MEHVRSILTALNNHQNVEPIPWHWSVSKIQNPTSMVLAIFLGSHRNPNTPAVTVISDHVRAKRSCMIFQSCSSIPLPNPSRDTINQANARLTSSYSDSRTLPPIKHKTTDCHGLFNSPAIARQISQATLIGFTAISLVKCGEAYKTG